MGFVSRFSSGLAKRFNFTKRLDGMIESVAPERAHRRLAFRNACDFQRDYRNRYGKVKSPLTGFRSGAYDGGKIDRSNSEWNPPIGDANSDTLDDLPTLRARSADLGRNDGHAAGILETEVSNVVGTGFLAEPTIDFVALGLTKERAKEVGAEMKRVWRHWQPWADVSNHLDFREMQQVVLRGILERGDIFLIRRTKTDGRRPLAFCWQLVEADRVGTSAFQVEDEILDNGNRVSAGVEVDRDGAPVAYWVLKDHPGTDSWSWVWGSTEEKDVERIPAFDDQGRPNVLHLYFQKRPGQTRGVPFFAPVILYFQRLASYMEAELIAARIAACFGVIFNKTSQFGDATANPAGVTTTDDAGRKIEELQPGMIGHTVDTDMYQIKSERPGDQFDPFVSRILRMICAGVGLPYELVAKDFSQSNYSNMRAALLEARRFFKMHQAYLSRELCQPTWGLVMEEAFVRNMWGRSVKSFFSNERDWLWVKWIPNGWEWVDPPREVKAEIAAVEANLISHQDAVASRGGDLDEVLIANANARHEKRSLGLYDYPIEAKNDKLLFDTGVPVSIAGQQEIYNREAPTSPEDSTIKPEAKPEDTPPPNGDNPDGDDPDE